MLLIEGKHYFKNCNLLSRLVLSFFLFIFVIISTISFLPAYKCNQTPPPPFLWRHYLHKVLSWLYTDGKWLCYQ